MKFKKLVGMGMAAVIVCSNLPQMTVQAQQIQEEAVGDIQSEEEKKKNPEEISLAQEEEKAEHSEVIRGEEAAREGTKEESLEQEIKQQDLQNLEIEPEEDVKEVNPSQEGQWYQNFQYQELADGMLEIIDYKEDSVTEVIIPAEIEGKKVTSIGYRAFESCSSLRSISIPKGVTSIGYRAFSGCSSLSSISIPEGVTDIGECAFSGCSSLRSISIPEEVTSIGDSAFESCSSLRSISIPEGVTSIGYYAFSGCSNLSSISIPEGVTSIGYRAFSRCISLRSISIPEGVTDIGECAFSGCSSLRSISIPEGVTKIGKEAFSGCSSLKEIIVSENNMMYTSESGILYNKDMTELIRYPEGKIGEVVISEGVTSIGDWAFSRCSSLESISIPEGVTEIGERAFSGCSSLRSISIPEGVTSIENDTFSGCRSLESISIPEGVTWIGSRAFSECSSLRSINIPKEVVFIGGNVFEYCSSNLTLIIVRGSYAETYAKENNIDYCYIGETEGGNHNYTIETKSYCNKEGVKTYTCTKCGDTYTESIPATGHKIVKDAVVEATCTTEGKTEGSHCSVCREVIEEQEIIPATGHTYQSNLTQATTKKNGSITNICSKCGTQGKKIIIYAAKNIKLSKTSFTYNNKVQKPSITVKDSKGKALKKGKDYTVTYPKGMKNVGTYTITIQLKGNYKGRITKTFTIVPKKVEITKTIAKSKGFTVKWKKQTKQVTGYQLSYSTSKKFATKATKMKTISNTKTTTKTISKLKAKKKYYVRVRTYKERKVNGKVTKLYSNWSKVKTVTTKK